MSYVFIINFLARTSPVRSFDWFPLPRRQLPLRHEGAGPRRHRRQPEAGGRLGGLLRAGDARGQRGVRGTPSESAPTAGSARGLPARSTAGHTAGGGSTLLAYLKTFSTSKTHNRIAALHILTVYRKFTKDRIHLCPVCIPFQLIWFGWNTFFLTRVYFLCM